MSDDLKPCPWCGAAPLVETIGQYTGKWFCADADCPASDIKPISYEKWNTRAEPAPMTPEERAEIGAIADLMERNARCTPVGHQARVEHIHNGTCDCGLIKRLRALARPKAAQGEGA